MSVFSAVSLKILTVYFRRPAEKTNVPFRLKAEHSLNLKAVSFDYVAWTPIG
jgi:hypothetical protein